MPTIVQYAVGHGTWSYGRVQKCSCEIITNDTFHLYDALKFFKALSCIFRVISERNSIVQIKIYTDAIMLIVSIY